MRLSLEHGVKSASILSLTLSLRYGNLSLGSDVNVIVTIIGENQNSQHNVLLHGWIAFGYKGVHL